MAKFTRNEAKGQFPADELAKLKKMPPPSGWAVGEVNADGTVSVPFITFATFRKWPWINRIVRWVMGWVAGRSNAGSWIPMYFDDDDGKAQALILCRVEPEEYDSFLLEGERPAMFERVLNLLDNEVKTSKLHQQYTIEAMMEEHATNKLMESVNFKLLLRYLHNQHMKLAAPLEDSDARYYPNDDLILMTTDADSDPHTVTVTFKYLTLDNETLVDTLASVENPIPQYEADDVTGPVVRAIADSVAEPSCKETDTKE